MPFFTSRPCGAMCKWGMSCGLTLILINRGAHALVMTWDKGTRVPLFLSVGIGACMPLSHVITRAHMRAPVYLVGSEHGGSGMLEPSWIAARARCHYGTCIPVSAHCWWPHSHFWGHQLHALARKLYLHVLGSKISDNGQEINNDWFKSWLQLWMKG